MLYVVFSWCGLYDALPLSHPTPNKQQRMFVPVVCPISENLPLSVHLWFYQSCQDSVTPAKHNIELYKVCLLYS